MEGEIEEEILADCKKLNPDVVLMDISMKETDGIEVTRKLRLANASVKILAVSMHNEPQYIKSMLDSGANGYILKSTGRNEMITAIKTIYEGATFLSNEVSQNLLRGLNAQQTQSNVRLTPREIEVLKMIAEEYTNQEIADALFISTRTVDTHRRNLLEKLGLKNNAGLVKYAILNKLI